MGTPQIALWRGVGFLGIIVTILAVISEIRVAESVSRWTHAVVLIGVPLLVYLIAGIGHGVIKRLEGIETALRGSRGPLP